jgi:hypothetical protein
MKLTFLPVSLLSIAALCGGCADRSAPPADASARVMCRNGSPLTAGGECGGKGGSDRQATREKSQVQRETQAAGAAAANKPGQVWATPASKSYYCQGDRDYGQAKEGKYMSESEAIAKGLHASGGKHCGG